MEYVFRFKTFLFGILLAGKIFAQGSLAIMPMSKFTSNNEAPISFSINNLITEPLFLQIEWKCDVDGQELEGAACESQFNLSLSEDLKDSTLKIAPSSAVEARVYLKQKPQRYALFKPIFSPMVARNAPAKGMNFEFNYQVGYLFLMSSEEVRLGTPDFKTISQKDRRVARFELDLTTLKMPTVVSGSVRIIDRKTKKMLRFARLAQDKILDPRRRKQILEAAFAGPDDLTEVCYEMYLQILPLEQMEKLGNCSH